jgi:thiamine-monophosphate kinase
MTLRDIGEFGLIERLQSLLAQIATTHQQPPPSGIIPDPHAPLRVGIGDDAAVWRPTPGYDLVMTCDAFLEGRHFPALSHPSLQSQQRLQHIGHRAAIANLSDLAAMAAIPQFALVSLAIPPHTPLPSIEAIYTGIAHTIYQEQAQIIGGNITSTDGPLTIDITLAGHAKPQHTILRQGAQPGDLIGVTGYPGSAALALTELLSQNDSLQHFETHPADTHLLEAYFQPQARWRIAHAIAPHINAMADISDGLIADLHTLLAHNQYGATIPLHDIPIHPSLTTPLTPQQEQVRLGPSDDYELIFCAHPTKQTTIETILASKECLTPTQSKSIHWIGRVTKRNEPINIIDQHNVARTAQQQGWDHFFSEN